MFCMYGRGAARGSIFLKQLTKQPVNVNIALPAFSHLKIQFQIRVSRSRLANVVERRGRNWRASKIRMQNYACSVDDRPKRMAKVLPQFTFNRGRKPGERDIQRVLVQTISGNFPAQALDDAANALGDGRMTFARDERPQFWLLEKFVGRRKLLKKRRLGRAWHRRIIPRRMRSRSESSIPPTACAAPPAGL